MNSLKDLKIGKWYQSENRIFMPLEKNSDTKMARSFGRYPNYRLELIYLQPIEHMNILETSIKYWEVHIEGDRQYLYDDEQQNTIEIEKIKKPELRTFSKILEGVFSYDIRPSNSPYKRLKHTAKVIREGEWWNRMDS